MSAYEFSDNNININLIYHLGVYARIVCLLIYIYLSIYIFLSIYLFRRTNLECMPVKEAPSQNVVMKETL